MTVEELKKPTTPIEQADLMEFVGIAMRQEYTDILKRILFELDQLRKSCN